MSDIELSDTTLVVDSDNFYNDDIITICKNNKSNLIFYKKDYEKKPIYSYIKIDENGNVIDIIEKVNISDNACVGAYCFESGSLLLSSIKSVIIEEKKQNNEYYISSIYKYLIENRTKVLSKEISGFNCLGTPLQLKTFSSNMNGDETKYRFCFDLDNTLVTYPEIEGDYTSVRPIQRTINFLNSLHSQGHTIIIHTARRMRTHSGNIGKVQSDIGKITFETLDKFEINYDEIYFGKPYANFYIDDLSLKPFEDLEKETGFYNIHPETRSHNKIEIFDNYIIKYSKSIEGEKHYYENIPNSIKYLFPDILDFGDNFIKLAKIKGIPLSFINSNNTLNNKILNLLMNSINTLHTLNVKDDINIYSNYYNKVKSRIDSYDFSNYDDFYNIKENILNFLKQYELNKKGKIGVIHGDPVFTNILIDENNSIKMIDMRGKVGDELTVYGDIFYDYAKIYQSIIGYDHVLMDKEIEDYSYIENNKKIFKEFILNKFGEEALFNIKQLTKSLLLSLIPIHDNDKCNKYYELINKV